MLIAVVANEEIAREFAQRSLPDHVQVRYFDDIRDIPSAANALFFLKDEDQLRENCTAIAKQTIPVFVHAVITTMGELPGNCIRINAWPGFITRSIFEIVSAAANEQYVSEFFKELQWSFKLVPDVPGLLAARVISMIINEAYFALADEISSKHDIDVAMKLGTNYPYGPFEWGQRVGLRNIAGLLTQLEKESQRYTPAPLLLKENNL